MNVQFHTELDKQLFLLECGKSLYDRITEDDHKLFIQRRQKIGSMFKNFRKSKTAEREWNRHRFKMLQAVRDYHKSAEGKKHHRQLGRWLATRSFIPKAGLFGKRESLELTELLKDELSFYLSVPDQLLLEELIELLSGQ
jgi:hypothetical protein